MEPIKLTFNPEPAKKLGTVFIVEDSNMDRSMLLDFFISNYPNLLVKSFVNGTDCVKEIVVTSISPDIILMDYFLDSEDSKNADGLEMLSKIKEISPRSAVIMHTAVENKRIMELAREKGAFDYVVKGADGFKKLASIIENDFTLILPPPTNS